MQASPAQQAEMKKIRALHDKLGAELNSLSQKMSSMQAGRPEAAAGAQSQVSCAFLHTMHKCRYHGHLVMFSAYVVQPN